MSDLSWMRPKLAELCGLKYDHRWDSVQFEAGGQWKAWNPDEDVAQAVRCLDSLKFDCGITKRCNVVGVGPFWDCWIEAHAEENGFPTCRSGVTPAWAICLAVAAALGWTEEAAERGER